MYQLSDTIERKFVDSLEVSEWEIETESGWVDITHINKTVEYDVWRLETEAGLSIECADNHIVFRDDHSEVFVKDLLVGDKIIGQHGVEAVKSIYDLNKLENMYDLSVTGNHTYYAEGILHHNTITAAVYLLWYVIFNSDKTVAILANKQATADEILHRIRMAYELLPKWLQSGVKSWNKRSIELENGSRLFCAATSSTGIRGKSINMLYCVAGKTNITVRNKSTGEIKNLTIGEFAESINNTKANSSRELNNDNIFSVYISDSMDKT